MTMSLEHINLLAALIYREAANYIETHQCEYSEWSAAKSCDATGTKSPVKNRQKGGHLNE
ncbi:MAG: hypothetical protein NC311_10870 [Muribaculaceae bacterium]|nr:hypothetical protein [Muribaculaceae bacterium]